MNTRACLLHILGADILLPVCVFHHLKLETLLEHYAAFSGSYGIGRHIDIVAILDKGLIMLAGKPQAMGDWAPLISLEGFGGQAGKARTSRRA